VGGRNITAILTGGSVKGLGEKRALQEVWSGGRNLCPHSVAVRPWPLSGKLTKDPSFWSLRTKYQNV
jgi:hypothetical protein